VEADSGMPRIKAPGIGTFKALAPIPPVSGRRGATPPGLEVEVGRLSG
jgi:hypothetical protein